MRMNAVFSLMLLAGAAYALASGRAGEAQAALLAGGSQAVELCLSLAGAYAFFGGLTGVMRASGAADWLAARLRRPLARLLRPAPGEEAALGDAAVNLAANMLGLSGAATPAGLEAMRKLAAAGRPGEASDAMIAFLVVNTTSVQLLPASMIALRAQAGAARPADIVPAALLATAVSTVCGVLACRLLSRVWPRRAK